MRRVPVVPGDDDDFKLIPHGALTPSLSLNVRREDGQEDSDAQLVKLKISRTFFALPSEMGQVP